MAVTSAFARPLAVSSVCESAGLRDAGGREVLLDEPVGVELEEARALVGAAREASSGAASAVVPLDEFFSPLRRTTSSSKSLTYTVFDPVAGAFGSCMTCRARATFGTFGLGLASAMEMAVRNSPTRRKIFMVYLIRQTIAGLG